MAIINKKCQADPGEICRLAIELGVSNATAAVLLNRGIDSEEIGRQFLDCGDSLINDPFLMLGMYEAVDLINDALENERKITIYGDYDVDGITSTCILYKYLKSLGANVMAYLPNRFVEGYGVNSEAIQKAYAKGTDILITLDCGITAIKEIELAKELGMDVLVMDHHNPPEVLPDADIIIDPKQPDCAYPFKELCSAGLAIKLVEAHGGREAAEQYYDIAAIGTVADIAPLVDENRFYVKKGIEKINTAPSNAIKAIKAVAGLDGKTLTSTEIAFNIAPRLNAVGRLESPKASLQLFLSEDFKTAFELATKINECNEKRRELEKTVIDESKSMLKNVDVFSKKIIITVGNGWNKGVNGLAAAKIVETYNRPAIAISNDNGDCTASARSIPGFDLYSALASCRDLYTKFGGHSQAAGFSLKLENVPELITRLDAYAEEHMTEDNLIPKIDCEFALSPSDIDMKTAKELRMLAPFGKDNEPPLFEADRLEFTNATVIGKTKTTLKASLNAGGLGIDCIGFSMASYIDVAACKARKKAVFSVDINEWADVEKVQLGLKFIKLTVADETDVEAIENIMDARLFEAFVNGYVSNAPQNEATSSLDEAVEAFKAHKMGTLAVVNDKKSLFELIAKLKSANVADNVDIFIGTIPEQHEFGANMILAMPYRDAITNGEFANVFMPEYAGRIISENVKNVTYYKSNNPFETEKTIAREDFVRVYKALHESQHKLPQWSSLDTVIELLESASSVKVTPFELKLVLSVFGELGFIRYENVDNMLNIGFANNVKKRQLTESSLFEKYTSAFNA